MKKEAFNKLKFGDRVKIKDEKTLMATSKYSEGIPEGWGMNRAKCNKFFDQEGTIVSVGARSHKVRVGQLTLSIRWDQMDKLEISEGHEPQWRKNARARAQATIFIEGDIYG